MALGMFMYSAGWIGCILPANGVGGGATGLSLILSHICSRYLGFEVQIGTFVFIINALLLLIAGFIVGWNFGIKTIFCITMISLSMNCIQTGLAEGHAWVQPLTLLPGALDNRLLLIILGGLMAGIGVAMCFRQGGSTGGTDIVAMIINKYHTVSYGHIVILSDFVIIFSSLLVGYDLGAVIYGFIFTTVFGYTVDMVMAGNQQSSQVIIFTKDYVAMADAMVGQAHRGATLIDATGWYSKHESKAVMVVCRKRDTSAVLKIAKGIDPDAFITVGSVMGVYGKGFNALSKV